METIASSISISLCCFIWNLNKFLFLEPTKKSDKKRSSCIEGLVSCTGNSIPPEKRQMQFNSAQFCRLRLIRWSECSGINGKNETSWIIDRFGLWFNKLSLFSGFFDSGFCFCVFRVFTIDFISYLSDSWIVFFFSSPYSRFIFFPTF